MRAQRRSAQGTVGHAYSALNLRLLLAGFGLVVCAALAVVCFLVDLTVLAVVLTVLALVAAVDLVVIQRRRTARRREEPQERHSIFE